LAESQLGNVSERPELAQYHTAWTWPSQEMDWMKSMLLFFDGVAWLAPGARRDRLLEEDSVLAAPLYVAGLLRNFDLGLWLTPSRRSRPRFASPPAT
jgi:hypothetical protein